MLLLNIFRKIAKIAYLLFLWNICVSVHWLCGCFGGDFAVVEVCFCSMWYFQCVVIYKTLTSNWLYCIGIDYDQGQIIQVILRRIYKFRAKGNETKGWCENDNLILMFCLDQIVSPEQNKSSLKFDSFRVWMADLNWGAENNFLQDPISRFRFLQNTDEFLQKLRTVTSFCCLW